MSNSIFENDFCSQDLEWNSPIYCLYFFSGDIAQFLFLFRLNNSPSSQRMLQCMAVQTVTVPLLAFLCCSQETKLSLNQRILPGLRSLVKTPLNLLHVKFNSECWWPEIWMMLHQFWLMQFIKIQAIFKASCANKKFISLVLYDLAGKPRCFFLFLFYLCVVILFSTYDLTLCLPDKYAYNMPTAAWVIAPSFPFSKI